jgi:hypothetical protein
VTHIQPGPVTGVPSRGPDNKNASAKTCECSCQVDCDGSFTRSTFVGCAYDLFHDIVEYEQNVKGSSMANLV